MKVMVNGQALEIAEKSCAEDVVKKLKLTAPDQALAVKVNGTLHDLTWPLKEGDDVKLLSFNDPEGKEIFWHSSAHVLAQAVLRLWPHAKNTIGPAIENGFYFDFANLTISENDFDRIEKEVKNIISENYRPQREEFKSKKEALEAFALNPYKKEIIEGLEEGKMSAYRQGEYFDFCRGPHLPILNKIKAFKILKTSGAYWRGDQSKEMLTRIYGISFPDKQLLTDYLNLIEEAKKRDHKVWGQKLDLFSFKEEGPGMPFIHPKGMIIWNALLAFLRETLADAGYIEIKTPVMLSKELWERSGHWFHYKENMYTSGVEEHEYAIKPMSCPGCMLYYRTTVHSYRELPMRIAEFGHVHRHEASGALNGLFRVRSFHQDDAHIILEQKDIKSEILALLALENKVYSAFGLPYKLEISTRPEKSKTIGSDEDWEIATTGLKSALDEGGKEYAIREGEGAFYGPKIDFHVKDALGRFWQCGTIQLDMSFPVKFDLEYVDNKGEYKRPVMLHRTIFGSIERFLGILIEHFAGKFPLWISPRMCRVIPVAERHNEYARNLEKKIKEAGLICDVDTSEESVNKKIRNAQLLQINYMLIVGDVEVQNNTVSLRSRDNIVHGDMQVANFIEKALLEKNERRLDSPFAGEKNK